MIEGFFVACTQAGGGDKMFDLDLAELHEARLASALLEVGCDRQNALHAFAAATKPPRTVAYVAAEFALADRPDVRVGSYFVDLIWADEPTQRSPWQAYRGLRLALVAGGAPWMALARLADLRADYRVFVSDEALPPREEIDGFWREHRHRRGEDCLLISTLERGVRKVWRVDGEHPATVLTERQVPRADWEE